jgi:hypothetical protein
VDQNGAKDEWIGAKMTLSFDPGTKTLHEQVIPDGGNALLNLTYTCGTDPEGLEIKVCSHSGTSVMGPYQPWFSDEGHASAAKHYPLTAIYGPIRDYIAKKIPDPPAPAIKSPEPGKQYPRWDDVGKVTAGVIVSLEKAKPNVWYKLAKAYKVGSISMPEEAENRFLVELTRWMPKEGGGGKWHKYLEKFQAPDDFWNTLVLEEGQYRIRATHADKSQKPWSPWSPYQVFWVGDKADYSKPKPALTKPEEGSSQNQGASSGGLNPVTLYPIPFLASKPGPAILHIPAKNVEYSLERSDKGVWKPVCGMSSVSYGEDICIWKSKTGTEQTVSVPEGVHRARVRYEGGLNPWSDWRHFVAGNPPGGASVNDYLADLWVEDDPVYAVEPAGKNWRFTMRIEYYGYWKGLQSGPTIKSMVACIPQGGATCGKPNPDINYASSTHWVPGEYSPGADWTPSEEPHHYYRGHTFWLRPEKLIGKWILLVSVDPDNFVQETNEANNTTVWVFDPVSGLLQNGLPALEDALKKSKKLPEGLDAKTLEALRKKGGKMLKSGKTLARLAEAEKHGRMDAVEGKPAVKPDAMAGKHDTPMAKIGAVQTPEAGRLGAKLTLKDQGIVTTLGKKAGEAFDLVFQVTNAGDAASNPSGYSINCKALLGGPCPSSLSNKMGRLPGIEAKKTNEIALRRIEFPAGEYEILLSLESGAIKRVNLKAAEAIRAVEPKRDMIEKQEGRPPVKPGQPQPGPSSQEDEKPRLRMVPR